MIVKLEDEVIEFKEAKTNYSFKDIEIYFSAMGNEANTHGKKEVGLAFGVDNHKNIEEPAYQKDDSLQNLKKEIVGETNG